MSFLEKFETWLTSYIERIWNTLLPPTIPKEKPEPPAIGEEASIGELPNDGDAEDNDID